MNIHDRIKAFSSLSEALTNNPTMENAVIAAKNKNPWFTQENILYSLNEWKKNLTYSNIQDWLSQYDLPDNGAEKNIAIIMAGNIPLVGFHDFLCVLMSGNKAICKLAAADSVLLPTIAKILIDIEPRFEDKIIFSDSKLPAFDAVIATGSNNTSRYFDYYFGKYPHIIRHNRNSIAVLDGAESSEELQALADDIFLHFGLGCRSINKLFVPDNYDFSPLIAACEKYSHLFDHHIYRSNIDYHKALLLLNSVPFTDGGFFMLKEDASMYSPVSVVNYERYSNIHEVENYISTHQENLQCVASHCIPNSIPFGKTQQPSLHDYADGVDTMLWISKL